MPDDPRVDKLLSQLLDSNATPEEVCESCVELLPVVRSRWLQVRRARAELDAMFPAALEPGTSLPTFPSEDAPLPIVRGYEVESVLGHGGMGIVYRARHLRLNRVVALKMAIAGASSEPNGRGCLQREAEAVAVLRHPNIVPVHDIGDSDGRLYFTMEFVDGGNFAQKLAGTPLPAHEAAELLTILAKAVQAAHEAGVVHRDLKPANVLLTADGVPKISDFGLARRLGGEAGLSHNGTAVGTPSYMAPEQARGKATDIGPPVDIYALGAILYEALSGRPPFRAETALETIHQLINQDPVAPTRLNGKVPRDLETICLKCLQKDPRRRYSSAADLAEDLGRFLRGEPVAARPVGWPERLARLARRNPTAATLVVTSSLLLVLGVLIGVRERERFLRERAESARWEDRLAVVTNLQRDGRFAEARAILTQAQTDSPDLTQQIAQALGRLDLVERLDSIRLGRDRDPQGSGLDYAASSRRYAMEFKSAGLGNVGEDVEVVAHRLAMSPLRTALIAVLDDWAACAEKNERDWVLGVLLRLDPDPWRDRIRDPESWAKLETFKELSQEADLARQPSTLMVAFGTRWRRLGGDPIEFLERVQLHYPTDFWVNFELGHLLHPVNPQAAIGYLRAALAVRPKAAIIHFHLGDDLKKLGRHEAAIYHYLRGLDADPGAWWVRNELGVLLRDTGHTGEAIEQWMKSLELNSQQPLVRRAIRGTQTRLGRLKEVCDEWGKFLAKGSHDYEDWDGYAELLLFFGREDEYRRVIRELLDRFETTADARTAERIGRAALIKQLTLRETARAASLIDRALADKSKSPSWVRPYYQFAKAMAEYREGRVEQAEQLLKGETAKILKPTPQILLAMIQWRMGHENSARKTLAEAIMAFDWSEANADNRESWLLHILRREAESLIQRDIAPTKKPEPKGKP